MKLGKVGIYWIVEIEIILEYLHAELKESEDILEDLSVDTERSEYWWLLTIINKGWLADWVEMRVDVIADSGQVWVLALWHYIINEWYIASFTVRLKLEN